MSIRVTQRSMYNTMVGNMQTNLGAYMESVQQGSSQKKVNRPSDDPAGTYRILTTRQDITNTKQYQENVDTAKGWLNLADDVLSRQVSTAIQGLKTLAEQASTGTYDAGQRRIMADQVRQYFGQLLNLANTEFEGKSIFGGHKYDQSAFEEGLAVTSWDENWDNLQKNGAIQIEGALKETAIIQFVTPNPGDEVELAAGQEFRWTTDGGETWKTGVVQEEGDNFLIKPEDGGFVMTLPKTSLNAPDENGNQTPLTITGADPDKGPGANNGTLLYVRPAAIYQGDDNDPPVETKLMVDDGKTTVTASGDFGKNILVRVDGQKDANDELQNVDVSKAGEEFYWSYSTDGGTTWVTAKGTTTGTQPMRLPVPGGYVDFEITPDGNGAATLEKGTQALVHPARADLGYEIMKDTYLPVNSVGKDVFGGIYEGKPALDGDDNLFEVVGAFIGYLEGNNQEGCQRTLAALTKADKQILAEATRIGGMENRLEMASDLLSYQKIDQEERLSYVEDIDLTELLTKLTRQQLAYQTVLQSSSMIMKLSLANYV